MQELRDARLLAHGVRLLVKRDDLLHPLYGGNKWRKLKYNLLMARRYRHDTLITFGGAYSNHIHAVAAAGRVCGFNTIGVIRGEPVYPLNHTLQFAVDNGMRLHFLNRQSYRRKNDASIRANLEYLYGRCYFLPEGGSNTCAVFGCSEIVTEITRVTHGDFNVIVTPCGTGGTLAGLVAGLRGKHVALGITVLKNGAAVRDDVRALLAQVGHAGALNWQVNSDYHHGGYAKLTPELVHFMDDFEARHRITLDPVYTGKMFFALFELIRADFFSRGDTVVALHTGGLQGRYGMEAKMAKLRSLPAQPATCM